MIVAKQLHYVPMFGTMQLKFLIWEGFENMPDYSNLFVCLMGIGTVFIGLICIILLVSLMSFFCRKTEKKEAAAAPVAVPRVEIADKGALIAAVSAAIAEDMGEDISAIRITSIKKV